MDFEHSPRSQELQAALLSYMDERIYPNEGLYAEQPRTPTTGSGASKPAACR